MSEGKIAREFKIGNTLVRIATDYCEDKTPEDVERILERIAANARQAFIAAEIEKQEHTKAG